MKKNGISLIVLSITILVMAILAATVIIALEDTGIIGRSKNVVSQQTYTQEKTRLEVIKNGILTDNLGTITIDEYITELQNQGVIESGITTNNDGSVSVTTKSGLVANLTQDGEENIIISLGTSNATISMTPTSLSADITDGTKTSTLSITATNIVGNINWTSDNASVASVTGDNTGATVTMKGIGTATITASYGNAKATCTVTVTGSQPSITLNKTTLSGTITNGVTSTSTLTATTSNISGTLTWTSSNTSVATVSGSGNTATITMKAGGTAVITASYGTTSVSCTVTVTEMYTLSGTWLFNSTLTLPTSEIIENITFTSNSTTFSAMQVNTKIIYSTSLLTETLNNGADYKFELCVTSPVVSPESGTTTFDGTAYSSGAWFASAYRTVAFGSTAQAVSEEFYNWLTSNATKQ